MTEYYRPSFKLVPGGMMFILAFFFSLSTCAAFIEDHPEGEKRVIGPIHISGNTITRDYILLRELTFREGDTVISTRMDDLFEESRKNLLNTSLFNFVTFRAEHSGIHVTVLIEVVERWYIWPTPILEFTDRNLNSWWRSKDFTRVNFGFVVNWNNFRGRMENLNVTVRSGKNQVFGLAYMVPYLDKKKRWGAGVDGSFNQVRELGYLTESDRLLFLYDKAYLMKRWNMGILLSYRRSIYTTHQLSLSYEDAAFSDSLLDSNPSYFYNEVKRAGYFSFYYKLKDDHRDARYYPLKGWYADIEFSRSGLGSKVVDIGWIKSTNRLFFSLAPKWHYAGSLAGKWSSGGFQPYYYMKGLGYNREFVRGYEYYVIDGKHYVLARNSVKFTLLSERSTTLPLIPTPKFSRIHYAAYLSLNGDAGYVWNNGVPTGLGNELPGTWLLGGGLGLDIVTYYDKVMRIEYSINKSGESGIFIHFIAGI